MEKEGDVFKHNGWDNVEWGQEQEEEAQQVVEKAQQVLDKTTSVLMDAEKGNGCEEKAGEFWEKFYSIHQNRFLKERIGCSQSFLILLLGIKELSGCSSQDKSQIIGDVRKDTENGDASNKEKLVIRSTTLDHAEVDKVREGESYFGSNANFILLEIGCGTGSTVFPVMEMNTSPSLEVYSCDLSSTERQ